MGTEAALGAEIVVRLMEEDVLDRSPQSVARAAASLGIYVDDVRAAWRRYDRVRWRRLSRASGLADRIEPTNIETQVEVKNHPRMTRRTFRNRRVNDAGEHERRCSKCREWLPATPEHYNFSNRVTGKLMSYCRPCQKAYQADRYLSLARQKALADVGLVIVVDRETEEAEVRCSKCGERLHAGETVAGDVTLQHVACPEDDHGE